MDHLKTSKDRQDRWYAKHIKPRFIPVQEVNYLDITFDEENTCKNKSDDKTEKTQTTHVDGIPMKLLQQDDPKVKEYLQSHLQQNGYVIVTQALSLDECNLGLKKAWDYIEMASAAEGYMDNFDQSMNSTHYTHSNNVSTVKRNEKSTYSNYFPRTVEGGILPFYGSGHTSFMWYLRCHPSIKHIFATIHNVTSENLATSLDGMIVWIDPPNDRGWFHIDQNPITKPGFESVQGLVNLLPVNEKTGGNVLIQKSHLLFPNHYLKKKEDKIESNASNNTLFYEDRLTEINGDDWLEIDPYDDEILDPSNVISCMLGPGDVLIWDSRLVHCSYPPSSQHRSIDHDNFSSMKMNENDLSEKYGMIRAAGLVNMVPKSQLSDQTIKQRIEAINRCRTLTHWVNKVAPLGNEKVKETEKETNRIKYMKAWQYLKNNEEKILLSYRDLHKKQRQMV